MLIGVFGGRVGNVRHFAKLLPPTFMVRIVNSILAALLMIDLTSCATGSRHQFAVPAGGWQTRTGQLLYRNATTTLIGEAIVRFSNSEEFELTFSKGPGLTLLVLRQDRTFAEVKGALASRSRGSWSGPIDRAPTRLRGWLQLRDQIIQAQGRKTIRVASGGETFLFRF
jgi:hypothetical protein